jgi:hypothetical protein
MLAGLIQEPRRERSEASAWRRRLGRAPATTRQTRTATKARWARVGRGARELPRERVDMPERDWDWDSTGSATEPESRLDGSISSGIDHECKAETGSHLNPSPVPSPSMFSLVITSEGLGRSHTPSVWYLKDRSARSSGRALGWRVIVRASWRGSCCSVRGSGAGGRARLGGCAVATPLACAGRAEDEAGDRGAPRAIGAGRPRRVPASSCSRS